MRTYPKNINDLEKKHGFSFPISKQDLESIHDDIILRHDLAFLFLKSRILNSLKNHNKFKNKISLDSFLDKKIDNQDRLKIYNTIKNNLPLPIKEDENLFLYYSILLTGFILPWITYLIIFSKEETLKLFSFTHPKPFAFLFLIGVFIVTILDHFFGRFLKKEKIPIDTSAVTIRGFICNTISQNRKDIKEKFEIIFKNDLEELKNKKQHNKAL